MPLLDGLHWLLGNLALVMLAALAVMKLSLWAMQGLVWLKERL